MSSLSVPLYLAPLSLALPRLVSLSLLRCVNRGEKEVKAWQALPRITRDINFTFQRLALSLSLLFLWLSDNLTFVEGCCSWVHGSARFVYLQTDLQEAQIFTHTHAQCKERQTDSFLCYWLHYVALKSFHPPYLIPS